jgi:flavin reductase (DIM6/NTAB) family NADH-FMN oxidoreductase RutF
MAQRSFEGFGERTIGASEFGASHDPCVLILPDRRSEDSDWLATAEALGAAGRYVITLDPPEGDDVASLVGDLNAVLRQLSSRPVIVGAGLSAIVALTVLGEGEPDLASGLVVTAGTPGRSSDRGMGLSSDFDELLGRAKAAAAKIRLACLGIGLSRNPELLAAASGLSHIEHSKLEHSSDPIDDFNAALIAFLERQMPRAQLEYVAGSDPRTLRDALGTFATGVTVVTTTAPDGTPIGLTANSFTSVSLDPPLLLVCPARDASSTRIMEQVEHFAVNVLHIGQQETSNLFATRGEDRFAATDVEMWEHGVPIIRNSLASFECRKYAEYDGGDHVILVGEVLRVRYAPQRDPLLYFRGKYRKLHFA